MDILECHNVLGICVSYSNSHQNVLTKKELLDIVVDRLIHPIVVSQSLLNYRGICTNGL